MEQDWEAGADRPAQPPAGRARLNLFTRTERAQRIFARLRDGWAYDEIGREEGISGERVRQIVQEVLDKRVIDRGDDYAHVQLARLAPALRATAQAVKRGDLKAVGPFLKVLDRLDKYHTAFAQKYVYDDDARERLLAKINEIAANLAIDAPDGGPPAAE